MSRRPLGMLFVACLLLQNGAGCVVLYERNEQLRAQEPRQCIRFESETAANLFQTACAYRLQHQNPTRSGSFGIIFVTCMSWTTTVAEAAFYNDEAASCDLNHDGLISEAEATVYYRRVFPQAAMPGEPMIPEPARFGGPLPAEPIPATLGQPSP
jgi:hypothetical protein